MPASITLRMNVCTQGTAYKKNTDIIIIIIYTSLKPHCDHHHGLPTVEKVLIILLLTD